MATSFQIPLATVQYQTIPDMEVDADAAPPADCDDMDTDEEMTDEEDAIVSSNGAVPMVENDPDAMDSDADSSPSLSAGATAPSTAPTTVPSSPHVTPVSDGKLSASIEAALPAAAAVLVAAAAAIAVARTGNPAGGSSTTITKTALASRIPVAKSTITANSSRFFSSSSSSSMPLASFSTSLIQPTRLAYQEPPHAAPSPFAGRTRELLRLYLHLRPADPAEAYYQHVRAGTGRPRGGPLAFALCGGAGVGKTALAAAWYRQMGELDLYPAMFWVDGSEAARLAGSYARIAGALGLAGLEGAEAEEKGAGEEKESRETREMVARREAAKGWFAGAKIPWLLVFDGADDLGLLQDYWPATGIMGSVLVTSRDGDALTYCGAESRVPSGIEIKPRAGRA